jgi:glycosyltransferase involved in cell wall biosynthesis
VRICLLTHYYAPERGAPQVRLHALATQLAAREHEVVVHTGFPNYPMGRVRPPYRNRWAAEEHDPAGFRVVRSLVYPARNAGFVRRIANHTAFAASAVATAGRTGPVDVVVAETPPLFTAAAGVLYARRKGVPLVLNVADRWPASAVAVGALSDPRAVGLAEALETWCYRHATAVVAPTGRLAAALEEHPGTRRVVHIPPTVDLDRFPPTASPIPGGPLEVVYAGTVGLAQGVPSLVEAAILAGPDVVRLTILGDGAEAPAVASLAAQAAAGHVAVLGSLPAAEIPGRYAAAGAGAVLLTDAPLFEEALPTKLFEVMAAGRPVLLAARGEAADLVRRAGCGLVVSPSDPAALAGAMEQLASDPALVTRLGAAGRSYVERHHARAVAADGWLALLAEAVGR